MKTYHIIIKSEEHKRDINTPANGRTNYSVIKADGEEALYQKAAELIRAGKVITEVHNGLNPVAPNKSKLTAAIEAAKAA